MANIKSEQVLKMTGVKQSIRYALDSRLVDLR